MNSCERYGHAWYVRRFGGIGCGRARCDEERSEFCNINGRPVPADEHSHFAPHGLEYRSR